MTNPDPQENSSFFTERSWNGRWLHSRLAVILIPCWAREQPLIRCVTNIFELNVHRVQRMAHMLHLLHFHYSELAIKIMQNSPPFPSPPFNGHLEMGLANGRGWTQYQQSCLSLCIQLICLSEKPVHGWFSMACIKWRADFTPLPRGQRSICWAATVGDI